MYTANDVPVYSIYGTIYCKIDVKFVHSMIVGNNVSFFFWMFTLAKFDGVIKVKRSFAKHFWWTRIFIFF